MKNRARITVILSYVLSGCFSWWLFTSIDDLRASFGPGWPFVARLTADDSGALKGKSGKFDVEFPFKSSSEANAIAGRRMGRFYDGAVEVVRKDARVLRAAGDITDIRPAKGLNEFCYPFTDGEGGGTATLQVTGSKRILIISVRGTGVSCKYPAVELLASKELGSPPAKLPLTTPIRLMPAEFEKRAESFTTLPVLQTVQRKAYLAERAGNYAEAEEHFMTAVIIGERLLDDVDLATLKLKLTFTNDLSEQYLEIALKNLARFYRRRENYAKEQEVLRNLIAFSESYLPDDRRITTSCHWATLAGSLELAHQYKEAADAISRELACRAEIASSDKRYFEKRKAKYEELLTRAKRPDIGHDVLNADRSGRARLMIRFETDPVR